MLTTAFDPLGDHRRRADGAPQQTTFTAFEHWKPAHQRLMCVLHQFLERCARTARRASRSSRKQRPQHLSAGRQRLARPLFLDPKLFKPRARSSQRDRRGARRRADAPATSPHGRACAVVGNCDKAGRPREVARRRARAACSSTCVLHGRRLRPARRASWAATACRSSSRRGSAHRAMPRTRSRP